MALGTVEIFIFHPTDWPEPRRGFRTYVGNDTLTFVPRMYRSN